MLGLLFFLSAFPLDGRWQQGCQSGYSREENFAGASAEFVERNFAGADCARETVETISRGTIELGSGDPRMIDFTFTSVELKPFEAQSWNEKGVCGFRDWKAGEARDVSGRECDFTGLGTVTRVPERGERRYGIVKITGGALYFGMLSPERDGLTPDRRPVVLDPAPYIRAR